MTNITSELAKIKCEKCKVFYSCLRCGTGDFTQETCPSCLIIGERKFQKIEDCPSCQSKKQGIILGAKMMIEELKLNMFCEDKQKSNNVWYKKGWEDNAVRINADLNKLNKELEQR